MARRSTRSSTAKGYDHQWRKMRAVVLERDGHRCQTCGATADQVDHIVELDAGGPRLDPANLRAMCRRCNASKGATYGNTKRAATHRAPSRAW